MTIKLPKSICPICEKQISTSCGYGSRFTSNHHQITLAYSDNEVVYYDLWFRSLDLIYRIKSYKQFGFTKPILTSLSSGKTVPYLKNTILNTIVEVELFFPLPADLDQLNALINRLIKLSPLS